MHRVWFKAWVGLVQREGARAKSFSDLAIRQPEPLVIEDARDDPRLCNSPCVIGEPFARFYCGIALRSPTSLPLGALCVIDRKPRRLSADKLRSLSAVAHEIEDLIRPLHERVAAL